MVLRRLCLIETAFNIPAKTIALILHHRSCFLPLPKTVFKKWLDPPQQKNARLPHFACPCRCYFFIARATLRYFLFYWRSATYV